MGLVVFENNKPFVIDEFREGRFDYVEVASDVAETGCLWMRLPRSEGFVGEYTGDAHKEPDQQESEKTNRVGVC
jgi:hypothetical protein